MINLLSKPQMHAQLLFFPQPSRLLRPQTCSANYNFIPYMVTPHNKVYCCESSLMKGLTELMQPSFEMLLGPICMPLLDRFIQLLKVSQASSQ